MKSIAAVLLLSSLAAMAEAPKRSGKATAQWIAGQPTTKAHDYLKTVIRLNVDKDWHVYWLNPGEAGIATSVELKLPEGWKSYFQHPIPKRFKTGGLHGFGHEGTVDYPLNFRVPENFDGNGELEAKVSWLTCNDDACIPGEMTLKLRILNGRFIEANIDRDTVEASRVLIDHAGHGKFLMDMKLTLKDGGDHWLLTLVDGDRGSWDPAKTEVFIETQELVPASAEVRFKKVGEDWVAKAPKGEFAPQKPDMCAILLVHEGNRPRRAEWKRN